MKLNYALILCLLAAFLSACHSVAEMDKIYDNKPVRFTVESKEAFTRGTPLTSINQVADMGVFAYYTGSGANNWSNKGQNALPNFMDNIKVSNKGVNTGTDNWLYEHQLYWPDSDEDNITFFAYSPFVSSENGITIKETEGGVKLTYTVPSECANQPDLMLATPLKDLNRTHDGAVNFDMQHALTCIGFSATGSYITIKSIKITNVCTTGDVYINPSTNELVWETGTTQGSFDAIPNSAELTNTTQDIITANGYLMMIPQTLPDNAVLIITDSEGEVKTFNLSGQVWKAGQRVKYNFNYTENPADITIDVLTNSFIGAFWRHNHTGERIFRMNNQGAWEVFVLCTDGQWNKDNILIDVLPQGYSTKFGVAINSNIRQMTSTKPIITGTGNISFRVGLKSTATLSSSTSKPRYALLLLRHSGLSKNQLIFLRQGEYAGIINGTSAFSPFNLSYSSINTGLVNTYNFVQYPTQAGGFKRWSTGRVMYAPTGLSLTWDKTNTSNIANICPTGYDIPKMSDFNGLLNTSGENKSTCVIGGLYADGYFDRKAISSRSSTEGTAFSVGSGNNIAYGGFLVYNLNTLASVFLPQAGYRNTNGRLTLPGIAGYYWSATAAQQGSVIKPYFLDAAQDNSSASQISVSMGWGNSQNEGYCIRAIIKKQ